MVENGKMVGGIVMFAMAVIVGAILLQASAQNVGTTNTLTTVTNLSFTAPANGTAYYFNSYKSFAGTITVTNASVVVPSTNYTITNNVINPSTGALSVRLVPQAGPTYSEQPWNITSTEAQVPTYIDDSGSRSMASLIIVLMALALGVAGAGYAVKGYMEG